MPSSIVSRSVSPLCPVVSIFLASNISILMFEWIEEAHLASRLAPWSSNTLATVTLLPRAKKAETFKVIEGSHTLVVKKQFCTMILERQKMNISMKDPMSDLPDPKSNLSGLATSLSKLGVSLHPTNGKNRSINHEDDIFFSNFFYSSIFVFA